MCHCTSHCARLVSVVEVSRGQTLLRMLYPRLARPAHPVRRLRSADILNVQFGPMLLRREGKGVKATVCNHQLHVVELVCFCCHGRVQPSVLFNN